MTQIEADDILKRSLGALTEEVKQLRAERETAHQAHKAEIDAQLAANAATIGKFESYMAAAAKHQLPGLKIADSGQPEAFSTFRAMQLAAAQAKSGSRLGADLWASKSHGYEVAAIKEYAAQTGQDWTSGGILIPHQVQTDSIIPLLTKESIGPALGVTYMTGMVGTMEWPTEGIDYIAQYVDSESMQAVVDSETKFGSKTVKPHLMAASTKLSWGQLTQTANAMERMANQKIARAIALRRDLSLIHGTGVKEPMGLKATIAALSGLTQSFSGVIYGHASDISPSQTITDFLGDMHWKVTNANYRGSAPMRYVGQGSVGQRFGKAKNALGVNLFTNTASAKVTNFDGYEMLFAQQLQAPTPSDTEAELYFGDFSQLVDLSWMDFRIRAVEENDDARRARMTIIAHQSHDVLVMQVRAFCQATALNVS